MNPGVQSCCTWANGILDSKLLGQVYSTLRSHAKYFFHFTSGTGHGADLLVIFKKQRFQKEKVIFRRYSATALLEAVFLYFVSLLLYELWLRVTFVLCSMSKSESEYWRFHPISRGSLRLGINRLI